MRISKYQQYFYCHCSYTCYMAPFLSTAFRGAAFIRGETLIRGRRLFEARRLLKEIR